MDLCKRFGETPQNIYIGQSIGIQYRSAIFVTSSAQEEEVLKQKCGRLGSRKLKQLLFDFSSKKTHSRKNI